MADTASSAKPNGNRRQLLTGLAAVVVVGVAGWGLYQVFIGSHHVETDNAYVGAEVAQVTPLISGPVAKVLVSETQTVAAGQPLVVIDDADARIAVPPPRPHSARPSARCKATSPATTPWPARSRLATPTSPAPPPP